MPPKKKKHTHTHKKAVTRENKRIKSTAKMFKHSPENIKLHQDKYKSFYDKFMHTYIT